MNQEKIREVSLLVAREMDFECGHPAVDKYYIDFLTRCLQELSKDVEPVAYMEWHEDHEAYFLAYTKNSAATQKPLYLHPPLTEQDKLNAARWRYARLHGAWESEAWMNSATPEEIDDAIDRAMENGKCS